MKRIFFSKNVQDNTTLFKDASFYDNEKCKDEKFPDFMF